MTDMTRIAVGIVAVVVGSAAPAMAGHASMDVEESAVAMVWHPAPIVVTAAPGTAAAPAPTDERTAVSFAWRTTSGFRFGKWGMAVDFDYNPMALVGWRVDGLFMPHVGPLLFRTGFAAAGGMWFDSKSPAFGVSALGYVSAIAGARWRFGKYVILGVSVERTLVSTRDFWGAVITIGLDGPM
jgi:hypothetical protein